MLRPLEELIHAYFARTWPIAACENQLDVINGGLIPTLRMRASRHQNLQELLTQTQISAFCIEILYPASEAQGIQVFGVLYHTSATSGGRLVRTREFLAI